MTSSLRLQQLLRLLDLTRLSDNDSDTDMAQWLTQVVMPAASPAAFCVYPQFISQTLAHLQQQQMSVPVATVVNFPGGDLPVEQVVQQIKEAIALGATEIDAVLPYKALLAGDYAAVKHFLSAVRLACGTVCLKAVSYTHLTLPTKRIV